MGKSNWTTVLIRHADYLLAPILAICLIVLSWTVSGFEVQERWYMTAVSTVIFIITSAYYLVIWWGFYSRR